MTDAMRRALKARNNAFVTCEATLLAAEKADEAHVKACEIFDIAAQDLKSLRDKEKT